MLAVVSSLNLSCFVAYIFYFMFNIDKLQPNDYKSPREFSISLL